MNELLLTGLALSGFGNPNFSGGKRKTNVSPTNPHNFPRFETDGFITFSINQESHDKKYAKYMKKQKNLTS